MSRKSSKSSRNPAWMNKELPGKLRHGGEVCKRQRLGQVTQKKQRGAVRGFRDTARKDKSMRS